MEKFIITKNFTLTKSNGFTIKTNSDTEVLLKLYQLHGLKMHRLNRMFAFAIWDKLEKNWPLLRTRMGVKPLYYSVYNDAYIFPLNKSTFTAGYT
jgi:asparagine synthase (glutamine-hydrolysing)